MKSRRIELATGWCGQRLELGRWIGRIGGWVAVERRRGAVGGGSSRTFWYEVAETLWVEKEWCEGQL